MKTAIFWNVCFYRPVMFLKNGLIICTKFVKKTFWTLINCSMRFVTLDSTRKIRPISSLHRNDCFFFSKIFVFHNLLGLKEMILELPQYLLEYVVDSKNCSMRIVTLDNTNKNGPKSFLHCKGCLFFQNFVFSTTSYVLPKLSHTFHSNMLKYLVDP